MRCTRTALFLSLLGSALLVACGDDDGGGTSNNVNNTNNTNHPDAAVQNDAATLPDAAVQSDAATLPDAAVQSDAAAEAWPPPGPFHDDSACALPACDPDAPETFDLAGNWTQTLVTQSHTCNALLETMKPEMAPGAERTEAVAFPRQGECVYVDTIGGTLGGVIKGNVMVLCKVLPPEQGVTPLVEGVITFSGTTGTGPVMTYLFDVPLAPSDCAITFQSTITKD